MAAVNPHKFEELFKGLFRPLCGYAMKYTGDLDAAKNLVHEVFIQLWKKFDSLPPDSNYKSYCYTAVRNRCLNHLRDKKKFVTMDSLPEERASELNTSIETAELGEKIEAGIASLPDKCRMIFEMNRIEGLRYAEIAAKLNISVKTVEAQMSKALGIMRDHLNEFMTLIFILLV